MDILKRIKPFCAKPKTGKEMMTFPVSQRRVKLATDGFALVVADLKAKDEDSPTINLLTGEVIEDSQFVQWQQAVPEATSPLFEANRNRLLSAFTMLEDCCPKNDKAVKIEIEPDEETDTLRLSPVWSDGNGSVSITVKCKVKEHAGVPVGLNATQMVRTLKAFEGENVTLEWQSGEVSPENLAMVIHSGYPEDLMVVQMPVALRDVQMPVALRD